MRSWLVDRETSGARIMGIDTQPRRATLAAGLICVAAIGCGDTTSEHSIAGSGRALLRASSCEEVEERLRDYAIARMNEQVERAVQAA
jgi:hypothetical protein